MTKPRKSLAEILKENDVLPKKAPSNVFILGDGFLPHLIAATRRPIDLLDATIAAGTMHGRLLTSLLVEEMHNVAVAAKEHRYASSIEEVAIDDTNIKVRAIVLR
jgi:hypothetical protein